MTILEKYNANNKMAKEGGYKLLVFVKVDQKGKYVVGVRNLILESDINIFFVKDWDTAKATADFYSQFFDTIICHEVP